MATTLQNLKIALQATDILSNVRRDVRENAQQTKDRITQAVWTEQQAAEAVVGFATAILVTLDRIANNQALVETALVALGVDVQEVRDKYTELRNGAVYVRDNTTAANVVAVMDQILSTIPAETRLF